MSTVPLPKRDPSHDTGGYIFAGCFAGTGEGGDEREKQRFILGNLCVWEHIQDGYNIIHHTRFKGASTIIEAVAVSP